MKMNKNFTTYENICISFIVGIIICIFGVLALGLLYCIIRNPFQSLIFITVCLFIWVVGYVVVNNSKIEELMDKSGQTEDTGREKI